MKKTLALILAIVMTMALVACGGDPGTSSGSASTSNGGTTDIGEINKNQQGTIDETKTYKKELAVGVQTAIVMIDPQLQNGNGVDMAYKMVYNQLVSFNWETMELEPELAESWTVESPTSFLFELRQGVKFSNGEEFTADDVVYTFVERPVAVTGTTGTAIWNEIEEIEVINDYSIRFKLNKADADFMNRLYLACYSVMNREACEADAANGHLIGTGGWEIDSWSPNDHVTMDRVDTSWVWEEAGMNPTERIIFRDMTEATARTIALQNGEIAATPSVGTADIPALEADANVNVYTFDAETLYYSFFNMQNGKFTEDVRLRKAVAYALNYQDIIDYATDGLGTRAISMWGKNQYGLYTDFEEQYEYNPDKARALLAEAGYPNGGFEFDFVNGNESLSTLMKAQLDAVGFVCNVKIADSAGIKAAVNDGTYDMMMYSISLQTIGDRFAFIPNINSGTNRAKYDNPEMMEKFTTALAETDDAARKAIYQEIQEEIHNVLPYLPLYYQTRTVAYREGVTGILWEPDTKTDFTHMRWEE